MITTPSDCPLLAEVDRLSCARLANDLADAGERFVAAVAALKPLAEDINRVDAILRAAEGRAGHHRRGPSCAQLAADIVCGYLAALRPNLPFVTTASAEAAAVLLCQRAADHLEV